MSIPTENSPAEEALAMRRTTPSWLSWANLAAGVQVAMVVGGLGFWAISASNKTDATALALSGVNSRLDRIFEKLDQLPVIQERLTQAGSMISEGKGAYATLDLRLRAIENNAAANHEDIQRKRN